jgi:hypothetical protein
MADDGIRELCREEISKALREAKSNISGHIHQTDIVPFTGSNT